MTSHVAIEDEDSPGTALVDGSAIELSAAVAPVSETQSRISVSGSAVVPPSSSSAMVFLLVSPTATCSCSGIDRFQVIS